MKRLLLSPKFLLIWGIVVLAVPNIALSVTEKQTWLTALCNAFLPTSLYALLLTSTRYTGKAAWWVFPLTFLAAFQVVLLYLFGSGVIAVDMWLNLVTTNATEALELLDNLVPGLITVFGLYLPLIIISTIQALRHKVLPKTWQRTTRLLALGGLIVGIGLYIACLRQPTFRTLKDIYPVNVVYNLKLAIERTIKTARYRKTSANFSFESTNTHASDSAEVYILVVGETARAGNFQLYGYKRETTPLLQGERERLMVYPDVLTESNTTHKSVPMLLSAISAEDYDSIYHQKGIITAFREAGFYTLFVSNQRPNHSFIDFFGEEADEAYFLKSKDTDKEHYDLELLPYVANALKRHKRLFVVLHTYGSHFNYHERYPDELAHFLPEANADAHYKNRESLLNAYDNTIRLTDQVLHRLIAMTDSLPTALLYTSDHGEDIFDDQRHLFLHASPNPSAYQLRVPFIISLSPSYRSTYPEVETILRSNLKQPVSSNASVFHTMLDLAGIKSPYHRDSLSLASRHYKVRERYYLDDHNKKIPVTQLHLDDEDRNMLKGNNIYPF